MPKINVTVELDFDRLPDADARDLGRQMLEGLGFNVTKVAVKAEAGRVREFLPKYGKPGSTITGSDGLSYVVWDEAPNKGQVWATRDGAYYRITLKGGYVTKVHGDGKECRNRANYTGCEHKSHAKETAAA